MQTVLFELKRFHTSQDFTLGKLFLDGRLLCYTLEPKWRDYAHGEKKVAGKSAIPEGIYRIFKRFSPKRQINVLELEGVPGFRNIQIHVGNTLDDTLGCILVGTSFDWGKVLHSATAFKLLMSEYDKYVNLYSAPKKYEIRITNDDV